MKEIIKQVKSAAPSDLRKFGFIFSIFLLGIFYFLLPWLRHSDRPSAVLLAAGVIAALAVLLPVALRPLFLVASLVGAALGAVNNRIILSLIFFVLFSPMALLMRLFSKNDPMRSNFDKQAASYRVLLGSRDLVKNKEKAF